MTIKIASRSSNLAIAQVEEFIKTFSIKEFELINIRTQGDIMSAKAIKELTERIEQLDNKVKQLYQQTYNPPTNNDLQKSLNDLLDKMNTALGSLKRLER